MCGHRSSDHSSLEHPAKKPHYKNRWPRAKSIIVPTSLRLSVILPYILRIIIVPSFMVDDSRFLSTCLPCVFYPPVEINQTSATKRLSRGQYRHPKTRGFQFFHGGMSMNYLIISVHTVNLAQKETGFRWRLLGLVGRFVRSFGFFYNHQKDSLPFLFLCVLIILLFSSQVGNQLSHRES